MFIVEILIPIILVGTAVSAIVMGAASIFSSSNRAAKERDDYYRLESDVNAVLQKMRETNKLPPPIEVPLLTYDKRRGRKEAAQRYLPRPPSPKALPRSKWVDKKTFEKALQAASEKTGLFEPKPDVASLFSEPVKTAFAAPVCKTLENISALVSTFDLILEGPVRAAAFDFVFVVNAVLRDYAEVQVVSNEMQLPVRRIVGAMHDTLTQFQAYHNIIRKNPRSIDIAAIQAVVDEIVNASSSIKQLHIDRATMTLNNLSVELKVLRDSTRL